MDNLSTSYNPNFIITSSNKYYCIILRNIQMN